MFTISQDKLERVVEVFNNETDPKATEELIKSEILADWNEGDEHQQWLNEATPQEIADWLASFYNQTKGGENSLFFLTMIDDFDDEFEYACIGADELDLYEQYGFSFDYWSDNGEDIWVKRAIVEEVD